MFAMMLSIQVSFRLGLGNCLTIETKEKSLPTGIRLENEDYFFLKNRVLTVFSLLLKQLVTHYDLLCLYNHLIGEVRLIRKNYYLFSGLSNSALLCLVENTGP